MFWARAERDGRQFRRSLKTADRRIAQKRLTDWLADLDATAYGAAPRFLFDEAVPRFIVEHVNTLKPLSAKRYGVSLRWLADQFAGLRLADIDTAHLAAFETARRVAGASNPTIRRDLACLSALFSLCVEWRMVAANPVPGYLARRARRGLKESPPRQRYLSLDEEVALIAAANEPARAAIVLSIETGLRRGELFGLTWDRVDRQRGIIRTGDQTKSGRGRAVPLTARARAVLDRLPRALAGRHVLCHPDGAPFLQLNKGFKGACRRAGITDLRWHDLRRTAGCRWLQSGALSLAEISIVMGHGSVTVTERAYAFFDGEAVAGSLSGDPAAGPAQDTAQGAAFDPVRDPVLDRPGQKRSQEQRTEPDLVINFSKMQRWRSGL